MSKTNPYSLFFSNSKVSYVDIPNNEKFNDIKTIEFLFNCFGENQNLNQTIFAKTTSSNLTSQLSMLIRLNSEKKIGVFWGDGSKYMAYTTNTHFEFNKWYHFAFVIGEEKVYAYINGLLDGSTNKIFNPRTIPDNIMIGRTKIPSYTEPFNGCIDEVRIWSIDRTLEDISFSWNRSISYSEKGLIGYWKFDEGSGSIAKDSTKNGINGSIVGAEWSKEVFNLRGIYFLIQQSENIYYIDHNYYNLGKPSGSIQLEQWVDNYGYNDLGILTEDLNYKKLPTGLINEDYYKTLELDLNDLYKENMWVDKEDDELSVKYDVNNYKIFDEIKKNNDGVGNIVLKEYE